MSCISTVVQDHIGLPVLGRDASIDTPPEILFRFATPSENGEPCVPTKTEKTKEDESQLEPNSPPPSFRRSQTEIYQLRPTLRPPRSGRPSKNGIINLIIISVIHFFMFHFFKFYLGRINVAGRPSDLGAQFCQSFDENLIIKNSITISDVKREKMSQE